MNTRSSDTLAGTAPLLRLALRQNRIRIPLWVLVLTMLAVGTAQAYGTLYPNPADRAGLDLQFGTTKAISLITGPVHGLSTAGGFTQWRLGGTLATLAGLMALFMVVKHTRAEEESGRADLTTAGRVGRFAPLTAALILTCGSCLLVGSALALGMIGAGTPLAGSVAMGAGVALCGCVFAGIAALTSQLSTQARTATGLAGAALGASYVLRGLGDSSDDLSFLSWLSPVGWSQQLRPYGAERWWVLGLSAVVAVTLIGAALALQSRRDVGGGVIAAGTGPATGSLSSVGGLAWRQHRGALLAWLVGAVVWGLLVGSLVSAVADIAGSSPQMQQVLAQMGGSSGISTTFINTSLGMISMVLTCFVAQALLRMRDEETSGRAELLLSTPTPRLRWLTGHVIATYLGVALLLLGAGAAIGLTATLTSPDVAYRDVLGAAAAHVPAAWILAGACLCLFGWLPRFSTLMWAIVGAALLMTLFGEILNLPGWLTKISPFTTVPQIGDTFSWVTLGTHVGVAALLLVLGGIGVRRRDLEA